MKSLYLAILFIPVVSIGLYEAAATAGQPEVQLGNGVVRGTIQT